MKYNEDTIDILLLAIEDLHWYELSYDAIKCLPDSVETSEGCLQNLKDLVNEIRQSQT
jgi:hypothetical protein